MTLFAALPLLPTLHNGFIYDDEVLLGVVWPEWNEILTDDLFGRDANGEANTGYYRPVVRASYRLEYALHGGSAAWFHFTNLLIHVAISLLLWRGLARIPRVAPFALGTAVLFAAHPIHSESICMITGRTDPLALLFFLIGFQLALNGGWLVPLVMFLLAQFSKESAAALLPLLVAAPFLSETAATADARRRAGWLLVCGGVIVAAFFTIKVYVLGIVPPADAYTGDGNVATRLLTFIASIPRYLQLLAWPDVLSITHDVTLVSSPLDPSLWLGFALVILLTGLVILGPMPLALGSAFFLLPLAPASNVIPITYAFSDIPFPFFERYLFIPSIGFLLIVMTLLGDVLKRLLPRDFARASLVAALLIAVPLGVRQWSRAEDFRSSSTLYGAALDDGFAATEVELGRAGALFREGKHAESIQAYEAYLKKDPSHVAGRIELASVIADLASNYRRHADEHWSRGEDDEGGLIQAEVEKLTRRGEDLVDAVLDADPKNGWAMEVKGALVGIRGDLLAAARILAAAWRMEGTTDRLPSNMQYVATRLREGAWRVAQLGIRRAKESAFLYEQALRAFCGTFPPKEIPPPIRRLVIKMMCEHADQLILVGKGAQAEAAYRWILSLDPTQSRCHAALGYLAKQRGDRSEAYQELEKALKIDPEAFYPISELFNMLREDGAMEEAAVMHTRLLRLMEKNKTDEPVPGFQPQGE